MLIFRLWGWVDFRSCGLFISAGVHGVFLSDYSVSLSMALLALALCSLLLPSVCPFPYKSVLFSFFTSATSDTVFYKQINFLYGLNPKV